MGKKLCRKGVVTPGYVNVKGFMDSSGQFHEPGGGRLRARTRGGAQVRAQEMREHARSWRVLVSMGAVERVPGQATETAMSTAADAVKAVLNMSEVVRHQTFQAGRALLSSEQACSVFARQGHPPSSSISSSGSLTQDGLIWLRLKGLAPGVFGPRV